MKLACPTCEVGMRRALEGVGVEMVNKGGARQLFSADLFKCPDCSLLILGAFGSLPLTVDDKTGYKGEVERYERAGRLFHMTTEYWFSCAWCSDGLLEGEGVECDRCGKRACQDHAVDAPNGGFYCNGCAEKSSQAVANQETINTVHKVA